VKILKQGLSLALLGAGLAALPALQAEASGQPAAPDRSLVQQMRTEADGGVRLTTESATGKIGFIAARGTNTDLFPDFAGNSSSKAVAKATAYLDRFGAAFGAGKGQLEQSAVRQDRYGWTISFSQHYRGVDVFGSLLKVNLDKAGDLTSVAGYAAPGLNLSVDPSLSAAAAGTKAVDMVHADPAVGDDGKAADTSGIKAKTSKLVVYRLGAIKGTPGKAVLAYTVEVTNERNVRDMLFIDAQTGKVVNRYSMVADDLEREVYEEDPASEPIWSEGDPFPGTLNQDQQNLVEGTGESYWLFKNGFDRDSYDGLGSTMKTVNNDPSIACPNANWNGVTTNYCNGVTSDDTVSHEWAHAYTEYTSGLIYQYQAGALNESFSDVWGETADMINDRFNETPDTARTDKCSAFSPAIPTVTITAPASIAGECLAGGSNWGEQPTPAGFTGDVVVGTDPIEVEDGAPVGTATDGCSPFTNAAALAGKIAMVDRGLCDFFVKAQNAKAAGVKALIIGNRDDSPLSFQSADETPKLPYTIGIGVTDREKIRTALTGGQTVTLEIKDSAGARDNSYRWLSGEGDAAFGTAIRDMWKPTCFGDPGKVSDAEYACDPNLDDAGGVHSNSGVPNHAFALVVDGGTFNGQTIAPLGLDKAGAIWWRTQANYLTPVSDFVAAADGLEQSCADLVGQPINKLTVESAPAGPADEIVAADCDSITAAIAATEMRTEPVQCDFQPLLDKDTPSVCGPGFKTKIAWKENFEDGLAGWAKQQELFTDEGEVLGGFGAPWEAAEGPGSNATSVAYGPAPDQGDCSLGGAGSDDFSSRNSIISPKVTLPAGAPRLTFDHYVATEGGYDGGNVKYSLNGGAFKVVPATAYIFNKPLPLASLAEDNTNPLAGQPGFSGTDGGTVVGSWGQSQVNLAAVGASAGDKVQLRFDIGRDGCGGVDGWYVDNVTITTCVKPGPTASKTTATAPKQVRLGADFKVRVKVAKKSGGPAAGKVEITEGGKTIATGRLVKGKVVFTIKKDLARGTHKLVAAYLGSNATKPSKDKVTITITR
jgi:Zn-dependent metalloprotease